ncbi:hypothetical protein [Acuticoccus kandeliae]|uniref:hypothetical protein n=1 Tax=Acuticoccus kandeliae TaxID=2073160 RepID=UPI001300589E|nr:hypothetical protein [Acuticoccus kandeliae]
MPQCLAHANGASIVVLRRDDANRWAGRDVAPRRRPDRARPRCAFDIGTAALKDGTRRAADRIDRLATSA